MKTISIIIYVIIAIVVVIFLIKDILSVAMGDHNGCGKKLKYRLGLPGFLAIVFFLFFTGLWSGFFW
jgi:hypothetical protein